MLPMAMVLCFLCVRQGGVSCGGAQTHRRKSGLGCGGGGVGGVCGVDHCMNSTASWLIG